VGLTRILGRTFCGGAIIGVATLSYAAWEAQQFTLRRVNLPLLPVGCAPLKVLHLSDLHLTPRQVAKIAWVHRLRELEPDLVINTGDNLADTEAVPVVLDALGELLDRPGVFVFGSNDYYSPVLRNPLRYLCPDTGKRYLSQPKLPWAELQQGFVTAGWLELTNQCADLAIRDLSFAFAGVDDPHLSYDNLALVAGPARTDADVRLGVAHAPYLRVLDQFACDGYDAIIAGHTHGGQICLPGYGALTTNCDLDRVRAKGLHRHPADSSPGQPGSAWLHVSAGLGTNPYTPIRLACRPEATLLTLTAQSR
jgi:uncharacterized protein